MGTFFCQKNVNSLDYPDNVLPAHMMVKMIELGRGVEKSSLVFGKSVVPACIVFADQFFWPISSGSHIRYLECSMPIGLPTRERPVLLRQGCQQWRSAVDHRATA